MRAWNDFGFVQICVWWRYLETVCFRYCVFRAEWQCAFCSCNRRRSKIDLLILNSDCINHYLYNYLIWRYLIGGRFCSDVWIYALRGLNEFQESWKFFFPKLLTRNRELDRDSNTYPHSVSIKMIFSLHLVPQNISKINLTA